MYIAGFRKRGERNAAAVWRTDVDAPKKTSRARKARREAGVSSSQLEGTPVQEARTLKPLSTPQSNKEKIAALRQRRSTIKAMLDEVEKGNDGVGNEAKKSEGGEVTGVPDTPPATLYENKPPGSTHKKDRARRLRESRYQRRNLYITGFGSFGDIEANPTQQIVEYLQEEDFGIDGYDCSFNVLHVSTGGVDDYLDEREACVKPGNINVHIGVHGKATRFALEKFCYINKDNIPVSHLGLGANHESGCYPHVPSRCACLQVHHHSQR